MKTQRERLETLLRTLHEIRRRGGPNQLNVDIEADHIEADKALLDYIDNPDVTDVFEKIYKYYN